jgi:hypothetical protein
MTISKDEALEAARHEALARGWPWKEPVTVSRSRRFIFFGRSTYEIRTNTMMRGSNGRFLIDGESGTVLEANCSRDDAGSVATRPARNGAGQNRARPTHREDTAALAAYAVLKPDRGCTTASR